MFYTSLCIVLLFAILLLGGFFLKKKKTEEMPQIEAQIREYKGYTRVIGREEYEFYKSLAERENPEEENQSVLEEKAKEYANRANAVFYIGNKLGLCQPYSFENLKLLMEQENDARQAKIAGGEKVYGLEKFTLDIYFQYQIDNLEIKICDYLHQNVDKAMEHDAKAYYAREENQVAVRSKVIYEVTLNGERETVTADREQLNFLGKADMGLADFLETGKVNDVYQDWYDNQSRQVVIKQVEEKVGKFEDNKDVVIYNYIRTELYPDLIQTVAEQNPVQFE